MKKKTQKILAFVFLVLALALVVLMTVPLVVYAEAVGDPATPTSPFAWEYLLGVAGCSTLVLTIVQYLKVPLDGWYHIPTRILVLIISYIVILGAQYFTQTLSMSSAVLGIANAFLVAVTAMGAYELSFNKASKSV
jgi:hypothetical protein